MRVVSQDGLYDMPYNKFWYKITKSGTGYYYIHARSIGNEDGIDIGVYTSEDRVIEVMRELQNDYIYGEKIFYMPRD